MEEEDSATPKTTFRSFSFDCRRFLQAFQDEEEFLQARSREAADKAWAQVKAVEAVELLYSVVTNNCSRRRNVEVMPRQLYLTPLRGLNS